MISSLSAKVFDWILKCDILTGSGHMLLLSAVTTHTRWGGSCFPKYSVISGIGKSPGLGVHDVTGITVFLIGMIPAHQGV